MPRSGCRRTDAVLAPFPVGGSCERTRKRPSTATQIADQLVASGHTVTQDRSVRTPSGFLGATPTVLCVDHHTVNVYAYTSLAERAAQSNAIQPDGSIRYPGRGMIPEWIATPHFFARGRLLVVYIGEDTSLVRSLHAMLGPAIPMDVRGRGGTDQC